MRRRNLAQLVGLPLITKRLVFQVGGYDPMSPEAAYRRFNRELRRFETTWGVMARTTEAEVTPDEGRWRVVTRGPDWAVETVYHLVRWDDVIESDWKRSDWRRIPSGLLAFADFLRNGALLGYLRSNWRYAGFFLYPYVLLAAMAIVALVGGIAVGNLSSSALVGAALAAALFVGLLQWPGRRLFVQHLLDDWIFARCYIHGEHAVLGPRLDRVAKRLCEAARSGEADEVLVLGHSLGAVLAIDLLDRALRLEPSLGQNRSAVTFISVGSSIPKIGLHRAAARFRAAVERVANAPAIFWGEYQALTDVMNFYKVDPVTAMGLKGRSPSIRQVRVKAMLHPASYRRIKRNLFRVHCQFVSANDRRAAYDYFMLICGPLSAENQCLSREGAASAVHLWGSPNLPSSERQWREDERTRRPAAIRPLGSSLRGYGRQ